MRTGLVTAAVLLGVAACCSVAAAHPDMASFAPAGSSLEREGLFAVQQSVLPPFTTGRAFRQPPVVRSSKRRLKRTIVARNGTIDVSGVPIAAAQTYGVGGTARGLLGPTLRVRPGDLIDLVLKNRLTQPPAIPATTAAPVTPMHGDACAHDTRIPVGDPQPTNLHFHGLHVTPRNHTVGNVTYYGDNVLVCLPAGRSHIRFRIPKDHDQGTFWYHAHLHGLTDDQVFRGLAGMLIVGDSRRYLPKRFRRIKTRIISLKDVQAVNVAGRWAIPTKHGSANPTTRTVNGLVEPQLAIRPGETQLWRFANSSSALWYNLALMGGGAERDPLTVVARDGNPLVAPQRLTEVLLGPAQRVDVLVQAPPSGTRTLRTLPFNQGGVTFPSTDLATVKVAGSPAKTLVAPRRRGKLPTFPARRGRTRTWRFSFSNGAVINDKPFNPNRIDAKPRLGTTERWILLNESTEWHPIHVHQNDFRVLKINGKRVRVRSDQDVVPLPPATEGTPGRVDIDMPFQDYPGNFVLHCHILDHEDEGMMARISVRR